MIKLNHEITVIDVETPNGKIALHVSSNSETISVYPAITDNCGLIINLDNLLGPEIMADRIMITMRKEGI